MLVPYGPADASWKQLANQAAEEIRSYGLFTDMEAAIEAATWDWQAPDKPASRSLILLTDGIVDVAQGQGADLQSRTRVLQALLPRLQQARITVYAIALSGEADEVLLQQLATATQGWFEKAETAENLERIFLRMFEKAAKPDTLPLIDNKVLVDESIKEMTMLIFHGNGSSTTTLTSPEGVTFSQAELPGTVRWHNEKDYDLITIENPLRGTWTVNADLDPDNRVMVVTDLRAISTALPSNISNDDDITFLVRLTNQGRAIEKRDFLHFVRVEAHQAADHGETWDMLLLDNGRNYDAQSGDGTYTMRLKDSLQPGRHTLTVKIDGTTFQRLQQQTFNVVSSPVIAGIEDDELGNGGPPAIYVIPYPGMIAEESMSVTAAISGIDAAPTIHEVARSAAGEWRLDLGDYSRDTEHTVNITVRGSKPDGKPLEVAVGPLTFGQPAAKDETTSGAEEHHPAESVASTTIETEPPPPLEQRKPEEEPSWFAVTWQVLALNVLVACGIFLGYRKWHKTFQYESLWDDLAHE
jgi:uncharacterized protein (TIGR03503 family)